MQQHFWVGAIVDFFFSLHLQFAYARYKIKWKALWGHKSPHLRRTLPFGIHKGFPTTCNPVRYYTKVRGRNQGERLREVEWLPKVTQPVHNENKTQS